MSQPTENEVLWEAIMSTKANIRKQRKRQSIEMIKESNEVLRAVPADKYSVKLY